MGLLAASTCCGLRRSRGSNPSTEQSGVEQRCHPLSAHVWRVPCVAVYGTAQYTDTRIPVHRQRGGGSRLSSALPQLSSAQRKRSSTSSTGTISTSALSGVLSSSVKYSAAADRRAVAFDAFTDADEKGRTVAAAARRDARCTARRCTARHTTRKSTIPRTFSNVPANKMQGTVRLTSAMGRNSSLGHRLYSNSTKITSHISVGSVGKHSDSHRDNREPETRR